MSVHVIEVKKLNEEINIIEIEKEYKRIESKWLRLHFHTAIGLVGFAFLVECILGVVLYNMGEINIPISIYIIKYLLSPVILNILFVIIGYFTIQSSRLSQGFKIYIVSFLFAAICFVLLSVHGIFTSIYMIFTIPILFTIVYGDYLLTTITALCSIFAKVFSVFFVRWDPEKPYILDSNIELSNFIISIFILCAFYVVCIVVIHFERGKNAVCLQREIEHYKLQQRLQNDELTAINNRTALRSAFQSMEEDTSGSTYIFVMIDIDNFKMLNDTLGHAKGDLILEQFGKNLKFNCTNATPFRFGGDEFCILFKNQALENVIETCEMIQRDFKEIVAVNDINVLLTVSFGIAHYLYGMTATQLLNNADSALYCAKTVKDTIQIYDGLNECEDMK